MTRVTATPTRQLTNRQPLSAGPLRLIRRAMEDSDRFVIELDYLDAAGRRTRRVISPIRFAGRDRLLAMCLCRGEPRQFHLGRCENMRLSRAELFVMPLGEPESVDPNEISGTGAPTVARELAGV